MAVKLDEGQAIFLGPGEGESVPGIHCTLNVKAERGEFEITEMDCAPEFGPVEPHIYDDHTGSGTGFLDGVRERYSEEED